MYCPNCELEIKGEGQDRCPICDTVLIENPFETMPVSDDLSNTEQQLKELIRDIDEKVRSNIEGSDNNNISEDRVFFLDISEGGEEPSLDEFKLHLDDTKEVAVPEMPEERIFDLSDEDKPEFEINEKSSDVMPDTSSPSSKTFETPPLKNIPSDISEEVPPPEPSFAVSESVPTMERADETSQFDVQSEKSETFTADATNTQKILEKALEELEPTPPKKPPRKKKSFALPVLVGTLLLVAVVGAGLYVLNILEPSSSTVSQRTTALPAIKKARSLSPSFTTRGDNASAPALSGVASQAPSTDNLQAPTSNTPAGEAPIISQQQAAKEEAQNTYASSSIIPSGLQTPLEGRPAKTLEATVAQQTKPEHEKVSLPETTKTSRQPEEPDQKPSIASSQKPSPGTFSIHSGSYRTFQVAQGEVRRLKSKGFDAFIEKVDLSEKGEWYRVKIGVFTSKEQADQALRLFLTKESGDARIVKNK